MAADLAVELRGLTVKRGAKTILADVDLTVARGAIMGVLGPNGAGKTTLLSAICGFSRPTSGRTVALGKDLASIGSADLAGLRRRIALLPQLSEVNELSPLSTREVVEIGRAGRVGLGRRLTAADHEAVDQALEAFGLEGLAHRPYQRLSGGEQRKTHLARVLAQRPELMLLDEPMANLDLNWLERLRHEIELVWRRTGATVIMVAHETHHFPDACHRIALMNQGRVVAEGAPAEVLTQDALAPVYGAGVQLMDRDGRVYLAGA